MLTPNVNTTATDMYNVYAAAGLVHTTGIPPAGAFVFYPYPYLVLSGSETTDGHIAISAGMGFVVSALETKNPGYVQETTYDFLTGSGPQGHGAYAGWAYPTNTGK